MKEHKLYMMPFSRKFIITFMLFDTDRLLNRKEKSLGKEFGIKDTPETAYAACVYSKPEGLVYILLSREHLFRHYVAHEIMHAVDACTPDEAFIALGYGYNATAYGVHHCNDITEERACIVGSLTEEYFAWEKRKYNNRRNI